jgi:hypothetical protein
MGLWEDAQAQRRVEDSVAARAAEERAAAIKKQEEFEEWKKGLAESHRTLTSEFAAGTTNLGVRPVAHDVYGRCAIPRKLTWEKCGSVIGWSFATYRELASLPITDPLPHELAWPQHRDYFWIVTPAAQIFNSGVQPDMVKGAFGRWKPGAPVAPYSGPLNSSWLEDELRGALLRAMRSR